MTSVLSVGQHYVEVWFSRGNAPVKKRWFRKAVEQQEAQS